MSLKAKIEAVIYASEEPVTLQQLVGLLAGEAQAELDELASVEARLESETNEATSSNAGQRSTFEAGAREPHQTELAIANATPESRAVYGGEVVATSRVDLGIDADSATESVPAEPTGHADTKSSNCPVDDGESQLADNTQNPASEIHSQKNRERAIRGHIRLAVDALIAEYSENGRGIEIREVASGFRMGTKPEYHDAVRGFVKGLKPALKLTLPALETLAVVAYKQPVTAAEISEIRGVDSAGVLGGLMTRKLIATAGRKQVIGRPMLYKTTRDFLLRFGLKDISELPSMEEFERMASELAEQEDLPIDSTETLIEQTNARGDAEHIRDEITSAHEAAADTPTLAEESAPS